jgi:hypothetical protein
VGHPPSLPVRVPLLSSADRNLHACKFLKKDDPYSPLAHDVFVEMAQHVVLSDYNLT